MTAFRKGDPVWWETGNNDIEATVTKVEPDGLVWIVTDRGYIHRVNVANLVAKEAEGRMDRVHRLFGQLRRGEP